MSIFDKPRTRAAQEKEAAQPPLSPATLPAIHQPEPIDGSGFVMGEPTDPNGFQKVRSQVTAFGYAVGGTLGFTAMTHNPLYGLGLTAGCALIAKALGRESDDDGPDGLGAIASFTGLPLRLA